MFIGRHFISMRRPCHATMPSRQVWRFDIVSNGSGSSTEPMTTRLFRLSGKMWSVRHAALPYVIPCKADCRRHSYVSRESESICYMTVATATGIPSRKRHYQCRMTHLCPWCLKTSQTHTAQVPATRNPVSLITGVRKLHVP